MDLPRSTPNHTGVYVEHTTILIPSPAGTLALVLIAKDNDGYYVSTIFETRTGHRGSWPSRSSVAWSDKHEAFYAGIRSLEATRAEGLNKAQVGNACRIYYATVYRQLTLF